MSRQAVQAAPMTLSAPGAHMTKPDNIVRGRPVDRTDWKSSRLPRLFFKRICDIWDEEHAAMLAQHGKDDADEHRFQVSADCHGSSVREAPRNMGADLAAALRGRIGADQEHLFGVFSDAQWTTRCSVAAVLKTSWSQRMSERPTAGTRRPRMRRIAFALPDAPGSRRSTTHSTYGAPFHRRSPLILRPCPSPSRRSMAHWRNVDKPRMNGAA